MFNDPDRRNALGMEMFDAVDNVLAGLQPNPAIDVVLITGAGESFCAGFDLPAVVQDPGLINTFLYRLSKLVRTIRRLSQIVVAAVDGPAIAGGCAILAACDFVFVAPDAKLGYPVHRIGVSPAVNIPTLQQAIGPGAARSLLMSGRIINGIEAHQLGLASHLAARSETVLEEALEHCRMLTTKGTHALRATKSWLNELDGSLDDDLLDKAANGSASITLDDEAISMLREVWASNR